MAQNCPVYVTADFIGKRWTLAILLELQREEARPKRYSEFKKRIPAITPKMLSARLKELEQRHLLVNEIDASTVPVKSEYSLTESGKDFINVIREMRQWALKWDLGAVCDSPDCQKCGL